VTTSFPVVSDPARDTSNVVAFPGGWHARHSERDKQNLAHRALRRSAIHSACVVIRSRFPRNAGSGSSW
jgi:hypothetical protein